VVDGEVAVYNGTTGKLIKGSSGKLAANVVTGPASVADGEVALFSGTTGKIVRQFSGTAGVGKFSTTGALTTGQILSTELSADSVHGQTLKSTVLAATDELLLWDNVTTQLRRCTISNAQASVAPRGYLSGGILSNNVTDATNDIDVTAGVCRSDDDAATIVIPAVTKQLDVAWAVGTNAGGRDTGSIANGTWHVFAIRNPTTGVCDVLFSLSVSTPTMPSGYTQKRRIGSIIRAAAAITPFSQVGDEFLRKVCSADVVNGVFNATRQLLAAGVPTGIQVMALVMVEYSASGTIYGWISSPDTTDVGVGANCFNMLALSSSTAAVFNGYIRTDTSGRIAARTDVATGSVANMFTFGWVDTRGRDG
jgi:hypothetical protein